MQDDSMPVIVAGVAILHSALYNRIIELRGIDLGQFEPKPSHSVIARVSTETDVGNTVVFLQGVLDPLIVEVQSVR